jgi:hypothetical protein
LYPVGARGEVVRLRLIQSSPAAGRRRLTRTYRWVAAWLVAGAVLALLLLANSIRDYLFVWRLLAVQQVRRELSQHVVALEQRLRRAPPSITVPSELLAEVTDAAPEEPLWTELRSPEGLVLARRGSPGVRAFSKEDEASHFRNRQALYKIVSEPTGEVVVEAFPVFSGQGRLSSPGPPAGRPSPMVVEVASPLVVRDQAAIWPIRRNLAINCSGALGLLATVVIAGFGFRSYARGRRLEQQMEIARQVQSELLPSGIEVFEPVRVATVYRPAEQVGGDFYDVFRLDGARIGIVMGDVSGKGMPAALVTGVMHGAVRSSAWSDSPAAHERESLRLNSLLCEKPSGSRYASMLWCYYDPATRLLSYVNAGHYPPFLIGDRGRGTEVLRLDAGGGPVLGLIETARYQQAQFAVRPGDVLVLYSDGLTEAANPSGEEYGESRLRALLAAATALDPNELRDTIVDGARAFMGGAPPRDDLTLIVARFA